MQQYGQTPTFKELAYISDTLKNEELLATLCVHGAVECQHPQLKNILSRMAHERYQQFEQLSGTLQQMQTTH